MDHNPTQRIYTVKLTEAQRRLVQDAITSKLHTLAAEAEGADFQHCRDRAAQELPTLREAFHEVTDRAVIYAQQQGN